MANEKERETSADIAAFLATHHSLPEMRQFLFFFFVREDDINIADDVYIFEAI
jgi:hypothetical protein